MYGVENRFKMQLLLGLKGSPLVGAGILNFVTPDAPLARARALAVLAAGCLDHTPEHDLRDRGLGWSLGHWFVASR